MVLSIKNSCDKALNRLTNIGLHKQLCDLPDILAIAPNFGLTSNQDTIWL